MKRSHLRWHRLLWLAITPAVAAGLVLGLWFRPSAPVNASLPGLLAAAPEAR